jgi:hypothetical protein
MGLSALIITFWVFRFEEGFFGRWRTFIAPFQTDIYTRYAENLDSYLQALSLWILPLNIYKPIRLIAGSSFFFLIVLAAQKCN